MASMLIARGISNRLRNCFHTSREIPKLQSTILNENIVRFAHAAAVAKRSSSQPDYLDNFLHRMDSVIRRTGRVSLQEFERVIAKPDLLKHASSHQSLLLMRCCGSLLLEEQPEERNKLALQLWNTMLDFDIPLDISHYNSLLRVYLENDHDFSPTEFLSNLEKAEIEPNRVTYQRFISKYCSQGDIEGACKILEFMKEKGIPANEKIFNSLIIGHARANDMESAHGVLKVMEDSGLPPSGETYMNLMVGYAEKGDVEAIEKVINESESSEIPIQNSEIMEVLYALANNGHLQEASAFVDNLKFVQGYVQDATNLIYRLINAGCDELAYKVFETIPIPQNSSGENRAVGFFFIKQLIKSRVYSVVTIMKYCQKLKQEGLNMRAVEYALGCALQLKRPELAMAIMKVMVEDGAFLRPHYFWPLLAHYGKQGDKENIYRTVAEMITMEGQITLETCSTYLMPALMENDENEESMYRALRECGMPLANITNGLTSYYLHKNDIEAAAHLLSLHRNKVPTVMVTHLANAYVRDRKAHAATLVLRKMIDDIPEGDESSANMESTKDQEELKEGQEALTMNSQSKQDIGGRFLMEICRKIVLKHDPSPMTDILESMKKRGISISPQSATELKSRIGKILPKKANSILDELKSGNLILEPVPHIKKPLHAYSIEELEFKATILEASDRPHTYALWHLFRKYLDTVQVDKVEEVKQKLEELEHRFDTGDYVRLMDMYRKAGNLEKALDTYKTIRSLDPDVEIRGYKIALLASSMITQGMVEESIKLLEEQGVYTFDSSDMQEKAFFFSRLLNTAISKANASPDVVQRLFDLLIEKNFTQISPGLCAPLFTVHLANDDVEAAVDAFEKIVTEYNMIPHDKKDLLRACIQKQDAEKLERVSNQISRIQGEMNMLFDLAFVFIECGKLREAKVVLQTPGLRARPQKLVPHCRWLLDNNKITELENLVNLAVGIFDANANDLFMFLLDAYKRQEDCDKAVNIWTTMQEENIEPSELFLRELGQFLLKHGRTVPFAMPTPPTTQTQETTPALAPESLVGADRKATFNQAIKAKNIHAALEQKEELEESGVLLSIEEKSNLILALTNASMLDEATKIAQEMFAAHQYPQSPILKRLIEVLSNVGHVDSVASFEQHLSQNLQRRINYSTNLCKAYSKAGRAEEFLEDLKTKISESSTADIAEGKVKCPPPGGLLHILEKEPHLLPKLLPSADKCANAGKLTLANVVWIHHLVSESFDEAKKVFDKYLAPSEQNVIFMPVLLNIKRTKNLALITPLLDSLNLLKGSTPAAKGLVYNAWVLTLCKDDKFDEALGVVEGSLKSIELEHYSTNTLEILQSGLVKSNKTFPYTIPIKTAQNQKASSSSSSSDSDKKQEV